MAELAEPNATVPVPTTPLGKALMQLAELDASRDVQAVYGAWIYPWAELKNNWAENPRLPLPSGGPRRGSRGPPAPPEGLWGESREATLVKRMTATRTPSRSPE